MANVPAYIPPDDVIIHLAIFEELLRACHSRRDSAEAEDLAAR